MANVLGEFEQIAQIMAPLTEKVKGAFTLKNDGAVLSHAPNEELVISTDTLIAGVHFFADDPPESIAIKALCVNLSDLAAMGAKPYAYTLNASYPETITTKWIKAFAKGLSHVQDIYSISLVGGDTTRTPGPLCLSITVLGIVNRGQSLPREGAQKGDLVYVSGTIGDSALGLLVAQGKLKDQSGYLLGRYHHPQPRCGLGLELNGLASACLDISDGLLKDLRHLKMGVEIHQQHIPLSEAAQTCLSNDSALWNRIFTGGDDYELLFCVPENQEDSVLHAARSCDTQITKIGRITGTNDIIVIGEKETVLTFDQDGYCHF